MEIKIVNDDFEIHQTPLETITIENNYLLIEFNDINEERYGIKFVTYQGFKTTTIDCFDYGNLHSIHGRIPYLIERTDSPWIKELKSTLKINDRYANFMDKAHHYMLLFRDSVIEIIAWDTYKIKKL